MTFIFAHRGYSAKYPENTMLSFKKAEKTGAHGIELDVQLSKDGEVMVIHDEKLNRTTNGNGFVKDLDCQELKKLRIISKNPFLRKESIPTLREVLEWLAHNQLICNIELKNNVIRYEGMEDKVIELVRKYQLTKRIILSSFNHESVAQCIKIAPEIETALIISQKMSQKIDKSWEYASSMGAKGFHPKYTSLTDEVLKKSLENGICVRPYTVNNEKDMLRLFQAGCTAFFTDEPVLALSLRKKYEDTTG